MNQKYELAEWQTHLELTEVFTEEIQIYSQRDKRSETQKRYLFWKGQESFRLTKALFLLVSEAVSAVLIHMHFV